MVDYTHNTTKRIIDSLIEGDDQTATEILRTLVQERYSKIINEDHEKYMTSDEMESHLNKLFTQAAQESKDKFLGYLAKNSDLETCTKKDFKKCANTIQGKGKEEMDRVIHYLEKLVGYEFKPEKLDEDLGNVKTAPSKGVPDGGADIPNVYVTKNTKKLKKKMHTLKKNVYGTGMQPAAAGDGGEGGDGGSGGE